MQVFHIASNEIKRDFKDKKKLALFLAFPILLIFILGSALSSAFDTTKIDSIHVVYKTSGKDQLAQQFDQFARETNIDKLSFRSLKKSEDGVNLVKEDKVDAYVVVKNHQLQLTTNDSNDTQKAGIITGLLSAFKDKYNAAVVIATANSKAMSGLSKDYHLVKETKLHAKKTAGAMDYYAISMSTMIIMYGAISASYLINGERLRKTIYRFTAAPVSTAEILIGKLLGSIVTNFLCALIVVAFSHFVFHVDWGPHIFLVLGIFLTEVILVNCFGLAISFMTKTDSLATAIITIVIQISAILGGSYFNGGVLYSPLKWQNQGLIEAIYGNAVHSLHTILLNLILTAVFIIVCLIGVRKKGGLS